MAAWPLAGVLLCVLAGAPIHQGPKGSVQHVPVVSAPRDTTIAWAKPIDGKELRVLFLAPSAAMRDATAMEARFGCDVTRVVLPARDGGEDAGWVETLRKALGEGPEAIVLGNLDTKAIPEDVQGAMAAAVKGGTGLLLSNVLLSKGAIDALLTDLTPAEAGKSITAGAAPTPLQGNKPIDGYLHALETEKARAVVIDGPGDPPLTHALLPPPPDGVYLEEAWREDAWSLLLRALRWVGRREPEVAITGMSDTSPKGPSEDEIPPDLPREFVQSMKDTATNLPLHPVSVLLAGPAPRPMEATFQLRRRGESAVAYATTAAVAKGAQTFGTQLLMNPGEFEVDCLLRGKKGVCDWWTLPMSVPGWPEAEELKADKAFLLPNDALTLSARVRPIFGTQRAGTLYARALDPEGTLIADTAVSVDTNGGTVALTLAFADLLAPMVVVEVYGFEGPARRYAHVELASSGAQVLRFAVRQLRRAPRFELVVDAPPRDEFNARECLAQWRAHGAGTLYTGGGSTAVVRAAELDLALLPGIAECAPETRDDVTKPCLSDASHLAKEKARIAEDLPLYWAGGGGAYGLGWPAFAANVTGEENPCQSDTCIAAFHTWLQRHYVDAGQLNAAWGSSYGALEDAAVLDLAACRQSARPAPWMNWRMSQDEVLAAALSGAREAVRGIDRAGAAGIVALDDTDTRLGYDFARLGKTVDFVVAPPGLAGAEKSRSYRTQAVWGGVAAPALKNEAHGRWLAWHALFAQMPGVWVQGAVPSAEHRAGAGAIFTAKNDFSAPYAALLEAVETIAEDAGPLILASARARSGVAVIDSRASRLACEVDAQFGAYLDAEEAWVALLRRAGLDFTFVTPEQAAAGALETYRAAILPLCIALGVEEAAGIARFAQRGGALVADIAPGHYTALGERNEAPLLDEWFGVKHEGKPAAQPLDFGGQTCLADAAARAESAEVKRAGDPAAEMVVSREKHHALLLNYVPTRAAGPWDAVVGDFLVANGCARAVELGEGAKDAAQVTRAHFRYGQAEILGLLAAADAPGKVEVKVSANEAQHVYDLSADEPGHPRKMVAKLQPGEAKIYALLPYEVSEVQLNAPGIVQQGKRLNFTAGIRAKKGTPGDHLLRVQFGPAGGEAIARYTQFLPAAGGNAGGYVPIVLGQVPGNYELTVDDLLSGVGSVQPVKVVGLSVQ